MTHNYEPPVEPHYGLINKPPIRISLWLEALRALTRSSQSHSASLVVLPSAPKKEASLNCGCPPKPPSRLISKLGGLLEQGTPPCSALITASDSGNPALNPRQSISTPLTPLEGGTKSQSKSRDQKKPLKYRRIAPQIASTKRMCWQMYRKKRSFHSLSISTPPSPLKGEIKGEKKGRK